MNARSAKAIQWSTGVMKRSNCVPSAQPTSGMSPWNPPKNSAMTAAWRMFRRFMPKPLHTDTANASMESPTAIRNNSTNPTMILSS